ncbi:MAG: hypothetical protein ACYTGW_17805, partial [Planctomycetota bacterium]
MTESIHPSAPSPRRHSVLAWSLVVFLLANVVAAAYLILGFGGMQGRLHKLEQAVLLYELERVPPPGYREAFGFKALLNHLTYWAPKLQVADVARGDDRIIEAKVRGIVDGMAALGPDVYSLIESTYLKGGVLTKDPATNDEVRRWLLLAARGADNERGTALIVQTMRAKDLHVSQRLRWMAADILLAGRDEDKHLVGEVLHEVLTTERDSDAQFFQFVIRYQGTGHPEIERTMLM